LIIAVVPLNFAVDDPSTALVEDGGSDEQLLAKTTATTAAHNPAPTGSDLLTTVRDFLNSLMGGQYWRDHRAYPPDSLTATEWRPYDTLGPGRPLVQA
jgi:hypothetical protein